MMRAGAVWFRGSREARRVTTDSMTRRRRYLVYHSNPLVAEDLRETLEATGPCVVEVVASSTGVPRGCYDVALLDVAPDILVTAEEWSWVLGASRMVVALSSGLTDAGPSGGTAGEASGIVLLPQPFRSDDVLDVLARAGIPIADSV